MSNYLQYADILSPRHANRSHALAQNLSKVVGNRYKFHGLTIQKQLGQRRRIKSSNLSVEWDSS